MFTRRRNHLIVLMAALFVVGAGLLFAQHALAQGATGTIQTSELGLQPIGDALGTPAVDIRIIIARIIRAALGLLGIVALGLALYAGFLWMTAGGNEERIAESKKLLINSVIGLAIILSAFSIASYIIGKLVDATAGGGGGGGVISSPNPYFSSNLFYVDQMPAGGTLCVRNPHLLVVFNRGVVLDSGLQNNIIVERAGINGAVPGAWQYKGQLHNIIEWVPSGSCAPDGGNDCLAASTTYTLSFKDKTKIKAEGNSALLLSCNIKANCNAFVSFTTGQGVDRTPPTIKITSPANGDGEPQNSNVPVVVTFTDDNGVQNVTLDVDNYFVTSQSVAGCQKTGQVTLNWPTAHLDIGNHSVHAVGYDWSAQEGDDRIDVHLIPAHCFDNILQTDQDLGPGLGETEKGPPACGGECPACAGQTCQANAECASGFCEIPPGVCVDKMRITDVTPLSGAAGTYVSVSGYYFGNGPGNIYFANKSNPDVNTNADWVEAQLIQCTAPVDTWTPWQILVESPQGITGDVPIKVVTASTTGKDNVVRKFTDVTYDNWGPKIANYVYDNTVRPGLCAVTPASQVPGALVQLSGKNLGTLAQPNVNKVLFGNTAGRVNFFTGLGNVNWTDGLIREVTVPDLAAGVVGVSVVNSTGVQSNGLRFVIDQGAASDAPVIYSISPGSGTRADYITITGKNFGTSLGNVLFARDRNDNVPLNGSFNFPAVCASSLWGPSQIIVKFNQSQGNVNNTYLVRVRTSDGKLSAFDDNISFSLTNGTPAPGVCKIDPISGPIPLPGNNNVRLYGENFGPTPSIYFWGAGASPTSTNGRIVATRVNTTTDQGADVTAAVPQAGTISGEVIITNAGLMSNALKFTINDCTVQDTCSALGNYSCCSAGLERGICKPNNGPVCQGTLRTSAYIWRFSTQDIPPIPHVMERCDATTEAGKALPTPSPSVLWDEKLPDPQSGDQHNVCRSAVAEVEFSTLMDQATVNAGSVHVYRCLSVDGNNCTVRDNQNNDNGVMQLAASSFTLRPSFGGGGGNQRNYIEIKPQAGKWPDRFWYQVVVDKTIRSSGPSSSLALSTDKPCGGNSAYCFVFKTDSQDCKMRAVVVTPYAFWTNVLEAPIKYRAPGHAPTDFYYSGNGLSSQRCVMMDVSGFDWAWSTSNTAFSEIFPTSTPPTGRLAQATAYANSVAVGLTNPDDAVNITARATTNSISYAGQSPLTIDLSNPGVKGYWPNCQEACTNADVGLEFTLSMAPVNVNWQSVRLYQCLDENCLAVSQVTTGTLPSFNATRRVLTIPHSILLPNAIYKVVVSSANNSALQLWSAGNLFNPMATSSPFAQDFSWRFKTKKDACQIDHAVIDPAEFRAQTIHDRAVYQVQPYSQPDACSTQGQKLDPWSVNWSWASSNPLVASTTAFSTRGYNQFCSAVCTRKGSDVSASVSGYIPICGNGRIEAGEDCESPSSTTGCGLDCRWTGHSATSTCGNGIVEGGEACDPNDANTKIGCTNDCRKAGSSRTLDPNNLSASICGNGSVGSGEDCDIGIPDNPTSSISRLGCSASCVHLGTRLSSAWCFSNGFQSGYAQGAVLAACKNAFSICGDGQTSPDEDAGCDLGNGNHAAWCSDRCLVTDVAHNKCSPNTEGCDANGQYTGSSLTYSVPSICGDTVAGIGEDPACENNLTITHANLIDPWVLAIGIGKGSPTGTPPAQVANISAATNQLTGGATKMGSGKFVIACGFKNDSECGAVYGAGYGVGYDSCCYARPRLLSTTPVTSTPVQNNVCRNTAIEAVFDQPIDPNTIGGNVIIAHGQGLPPNITPAPAHVSYIGDNDNSVLPKLNQPFGVVTKGNYAYVVNWLSNALDVIDISNKQAPVHVYQISSNNNNQVHFSAPSAINIVDDYLYVFSRAGHALDILSIAQDPSRPAPVGFISEASDNSQVGQNFPIKGGYSMDVVGNYAYLGDYGGNFHVIDVTDKAHPVHVGALAGGADGIKVVGRYAYVNFASWFRVYDVGNPTNPVQVGIANQFVSNGQGLAVTGTYAFAMGYNNDEVKVYDFSNPANPVLVATRPTVGRGPTSVVLKGQYIFFTDRKSNGLEAMNISNPLNPQPAGYLANGAGGAHLVDVYGMALTDTNYALVAGITSSSLEIADLNSYFYIPTNCDTDVTNLVARLQNSPVGSWIARLWYTVVNGVRSLFGLPATAVIYTPPPRWCVGGDSGSAEVVQPDAASSTSHLILHLDKPLEAQTNYAIILKEGLRDVRGVSIGTTTLPVGFNYNWKFNTGNDVCKVNSVDVSPNSKLLSRAGATTTLLATARAVGGAPIQPIPNVYNWSYLWGPSPNNFVTLQSTTGLSNMITAQNRNGEIDISASAVVSTDISGSPTGTAAFGKSHITVFLCENPWPPKEAYFNGNGPFNIFPYEDKLGNNDRYNISQQPQFDGWDGSSIFPSERASRQADGYFNFSTYYCADSGGFGKADDLPYLKPLVNYTLTKLIVPDNGSCESTGNSCTQQSDCGVRYNTDIGSVIVPVNTDHVCGASTTSPKTINIPYYNDAGEVVGCNNVNTCTNDPKFMPWASAIGTPTCMALSGNGRALQCFKNPPLKQFLFTNPTNDDVIGIQIFPNPQHLTPAQWFKNDKQSGGQGFLGNPQTLTGGIGGNDAVSDGNNVYVEAFNYTSSTENNQLVGNLFTNIYLFSINSNAAADTRKVFDQLLKNLRFNTNLSDYGYCGPTVNEPNFALTCKNDLECPVGQVCSRQVGKLKNNYKRLRDLKQIDTALENYAGAHNGTYPDMGSGSYLKGQTVTVWPSWTTLGSALGVALPLDPVNKLGVAGTCKTDINTFCTQSADCPTINAQTSTRQACIIHDPKGGTGWSTDDRRFSFACASSSMAYRYIYSQANGYQMYTNFEDPGVSISANSLNLFFNAFDYSNQARLGVTDQWKTDTICIPQPPSPNEISTLNDGKCGDGIVNWNKGERCEPPGSTQYGACTNNQVTVATCAKPNEPNPGDPGCTWMIKPSIACSALSKCGNNLVEVGETCDDGKLNGTYNHCNNNCQGFGAGGYCGDNVLTNASELCDPSRELAQANKTGYCIGGNRFGATCSNDSECGSLRSGVCKPFTDTHIKYAPTKANSCSVDCQSRGPYCGDGIVEAEYGEECDTAASLSCSVGGKAGTRGCATDCHYSSTAAAMWLRFEDTYVDQNSQKDVFRNSGYAALGVLSSNPAPIYLLNGYTDGAVGFNNNAQFVQVFPSAAIMPTSSLSVEAWVKPTDFNSAYMRILEKGGFNWGGGYSLQFNNQTGKLQFQVYRIDGLANARLQIDSSLALPANTWSHVVATYYFNKSNNQQTMALYVNGVADAGATLYQYADGVTPQQVVGTLTVTDPIPWLMVSNESLYIGQSSEQNNPFHGLIDEVKIFNRALSPAEVKEEYGNAWSCAIPASAATAIAVAPECGNGIVDGAEVCDNGVKNGVACVPAYGKSCSYCANDCKNVIDVQPTQYCGDGIIEAAESCDMDPTTKLIYSASRASTNTVVFATDTPHNGFTVLACDSENNIPNDAFQKGTKACVNQCSNISAQCTLCGISANGKTVSGNIINALNPTSTDPMFDSDPGTNGAYLDMYFVKNNATVNLATVQHAQSSYTLQSWGGGGPAQLATDPICSTGNPRYQMTINIDYFVNGVRGFDFPIVNNPSKNQYDLIVSPLMSAGGLKDKNGNFAPTSARPNDVRVVVSWVGTKDFYSGYVIPVQNNAISVEGNSYPAIRPGPKYYSTPPFYSTWYHGYGQTAGQTNVEGYTIDTSNSMFSDTYMFYVRADQNSPIENFRNATALKVDVYKPENAGIMYFNLFSRPLKTYYFRLSAQSQNPAAGYWHVFNVRRNDAQPLIDNRIQDVTTVDQNGTVTTYANGRIVTQVGQP